MSTPTGTVSLALREYTDAAAVTWQVWHVVPTTRTNPLPVANERRERANPDYPDERRRKQLTLTPGMEGGWLCFESAGEKRRLAPVPRDWESCSDELMAGYLATATPVPRRLVERSAVDPLDSTQLHTRAGAR